MAELHVVGTVPENPTPPPAVPQTSELAAWKASRKAGAPRVPEPTPEPEPPPPPPVPEVSEPPEPPERVETPAPLPATAEKWEDPDTGEALDLSTRRAKRIKRLWSEREALKRENAELRAQRPQETPPPPVAAAPSTEKPKLENFASLEEYTEALADWKFDQRDAARAAVEARTAAERSQSELVASFSKREAEARTKHADFDDVVGQDLPVSPPMRDAVLFSPLGQEMRYWLGQHPEDCRRIAGLPRDAALSAMGKVEALVEAGSLPPVTTPTPSVTRAAPPTPTLAGATVASTKDPKDMTLPEWQAIRRQRRQNR